MKKYRVLVSLDVLLDTRMGTLVKMDAQKAKEILLSGKYHDRRSDFFPGVDKTAFDAAYASRDIETLKLSLPTNAIYMLRDLAAKLGEQAISNPTTAGIEININEYPYTLDAETRDALIESVASWIGYPVPIYVVRMSDAQVTPQWLKGQFEEYYRYDYGDWLEMHAVNGNFARHRIPDVKLYVPGIIFTTDPSDDQIREHIREAMHPIESAKLAASLLIGLDPIDVWVFSIIKKT